MHRRKPAGALVAGATALALAASAPDATAHGGIPRAYEILSQPGNPDHMLLRSYLWGFFASKDGGSTWRYTCAEAYAGRSTSAQTRTIAILAGGRMLVANYFEGLHLTDDGCAWSKHPDFPEAMITDVRLDPHVEGRLYLASTLGDGTGFDARLFRSEDRGDTWQPAGAPLPRDFSPINIGFAPSDPNTLYIVGKGYDTVPSSFLRSRDGGASFERFQIPIQRSRWHPRIRAGHAARPEVIFLWIDGEEDLGEDNPDEYLVTLDEGATWKRLFQGKGDLSGFAVSPDGTKIHIGGSLDGIHEADFERAVAEGQAAFEQVYSYPVWSLSWSADGLLAGGDNYGALGNPEFTLGLSSDGGRTFTPLMTICDLQFSTCPAQSTVGQLCKDVWETTDETPGFEEEYVRVRCEGQGGATGAPSTPDAGAGASGGSSASETNGGGCGCRAPARGRLSPVAPLSIALALALLLRRRSRSREPT